MISFKFTFCLWLMYITYTTCANPTLCVCACVEGDKIKIKCHMTLLS